MKDMLVVYMQNANKWLNCVLNMVNWRSMGRPFLYLFAVYVISTASLTIANFNYADDYVRILWGPDCWANFDRWGSVYLSRIFCDGSYVVDTSPLSQWLSLSFVALSGVIVLRVLSNEDVIPLSRILAVIPLGISPYFLGCLSYKFDSTYMGISVLASVIPLLFFFKNKAVFSVCSFLGMLLMCCTYQASSGIFPLAVVLLSLKFYFDGHSMKEVLEWVSISIIVYVLALLFYKFFIVVREVPTSSYVSTQIAPVRDILKVSYSNLCSYTKLLLRDYSNHWKIIFALLLSLSFCGIVSNSKRGKIQSIVVAGFGLGLSYILTWGAYLVLIKPGFGVRCMYAFYVYVCFLAAMSLCGKKRIYVDRIFCLALSWVCIVFAFCYGNMLAEEGIYRNFRTQIVLRDLSVAIPRNHSVVEISFGKSSKSPVVNRAARSKYPVLNRLIQSAVASYGEYGFMMSGYSFPNLKYSKINSAELRKRNMPVVVDNVWNTIYYDGKYALIDMHQN